MVAPASGPSGPCRVRDMPRSRPMVMVVGTLSAIVVARSGITVTSDSASAGVLKTTAWTRYTPGVLTAGKWNWATPFLSAWVPWLATTAPLASVALNTTVALSTGLPPVVTVTERSTALPAYTVGERSNEMLMVWMSAMPLTGMI